MGCGIRVRFDGILQLPAPPGEGTEIAVASGRRNLAPLRKVMKRQPAVLVSVPSKVCIFLLYL